ncbi:MAG: hypothetical protein PHY94_06575 [Candidatus Omnitrophica bacterium]|nr:hypothetical protein [Candidatus Omnitrophota bacterium]
MADKKSFILLLVLTMSFPALSFAETIILKSGQKIEGKITERTDKYIAVDIAGTLQPYFIEDIESIDGQKPFLSKENEYKVAMAPELQNLKTLCSKELQDDVLKYFIAKDKQTGEIIHPKIISQQVVSIKIGQTPYELESWEEYWIIDSGGKTKGYYINFSSSPQGGVDFAFKIGKE